MLTKPIVISGLRKSGTSMVRNLLDGHPELFVYPRNELHFFDFTHYGKATTSGRTGVASGSRKVRKTIDERIEEVLANKWFLPPRSGKIDPGEDGQDVIERHINWTEFNDRLRKSGARDYPSLLEAILVSMAQSSDLFHGRVEETRFAFKGVQQSEFLPELREWFPDVRFVYVLRNPYGQINSAIHNMRHKQQGEKRKHEIGRDVKKLDTSLGYPELGARLRQMQQSYFFMRKWEDLYPENFYVLVYDRLLANQEEEMRKLTSFLEIEFTPELLTLTQGGKPHVRHGWSVGRHTSNEISATPLEAWREQLSPLVIRLVNMHFKQVLEDYDFEVIPSKASMWRRMDRSESLKTFVANRLLFTNWARRLLV